MRSWTRPLVSMLLVAALLLVGASCANDESLTGPSSPQASAAVTPAPTPKPEPLLDPVVQIGNPVLQPVLSTIELLTCSMQPYAQTTAVIGPAGGQVVVGAQRLAIPAGALSAPTRITAEQVSGTVNSVRFSPEGLKFAKPATLTMSYGNCLLTPVPKRVVYTDEQLKILDVITSLDLRLTRTVTGFINHFSRYAVAY